MKKHTLDFTDMNDFVKAWILDAVANSCYKGVTSNTFKSADLLSEAREIRSSESPNKEFSQSKLNRLATRIAMHEEQEAVFQKTLDEAAAAWVKITGKKSWAPYSSGSSAAPMAQTAVNSFFDERLG
jgi:hypothetical protein